VARGGDMSGLVDDSEYYTCVTSGLHELRMGLSRGRKRLKGRRAQRPFLVPCVVLRGGRNGGEPDVATDHLTEARVRYNSGQLEDACASFARALTMDPVRGWLRASHNSPDA